MEAREELIIALQQVYDLYGEQIQEKRKTLSAFLDFAPKLKRERRILEVFLSCGGHQILRGIVHLNDGGKIAAVKNLVARMNDEGAIDAVQGSDFCSVYWETIIHPGGKLPTPVIKKPDTSQKPVQKLAKEEKSEEQFTSFPQGKENGSVPDTRTQQKKGSGLGKVVFALMCMITIGTVFYFVGMPMIKKNTNIGFFEGSNDENNDYDEVDYSYEEYFDQDEETFSESIDQYSFYGVWCFSSKDFDNADRFSDKLIDQGYDAFVCLSSEWSNLNQEPWYTVTAGEYYSEEEAKEAMNGIHSIVPDAYVGWTGYYTG